MIKSFQVWSKQSEKSWVKNSDNLNLKVFANCEYLDLGEVYFFESFFYFPVYYILVVSSDQGEQYY